MIEINFHSKIYKRAALKAAIEAFGDFGRFSMKKQDKYYNVHFEDPEDADSVENLRDEFCNYVLFKSKTELMK